MSTIFESLVPLADIEDVLAWVDTFKLTRATKKIHRDFSDGVLLAEILLVHYPKLVEMHNYPPRNSHALKLNNWMTLNRKVLKKLKLNLCSNTMEQLANCAPGVIERVLIMVRDRIRRDAEANREAKENEQNLSSGGEYFEAGDDQVLVVPVKMRVNGVLETIQHRVVSHESFLGLKEELRDAKETADLLKQRVEHLDNLLKLKDERIEELQKQLDRKAARRHEVEAHCNVDTSQPPSIKSSDVMIPLKVPSSRSLDSSTKTPLPVPVVEELPNISVPITPDVAPKVSAAKIEHQPKVSVAKMDLQPKLSTIRIEVQPKIVPSNAEVNGNKDSVDLDRVRSDVFQEAEVVQVELDPTDEAFKDSVQDLVMNGPTLKEVVAISNQYSVHDMERMRHLQSLRRLKEEKTQELKKLIDRKGTLCNVVMDNSLPTTSDVVNTVPLIKSNISLKTSNPGENTKIPMPKVEDSSSSKIPVPRKSSSSIIEVQPKPSGTKMEIQPKVSKLQIQQKLSASNMEIQSKLSAHTINTIQKNISATRIEVKPKLSNTSNDDAKVNLEEDDVDDLDRVRSDVFKEAADVVFEDRPNLEVNEVKEYVQVVPSIGRTIHQEIVDITNHLGFKDVSYVN